MQLYWKGKLSQGIQIAEDAALTTGQDSTGLHIHLCNLHHLKVTLQMPSSSCLSQEIKV